MHVLESGQITLTSQQLDALVARLVASAGLKRSPRLSELLQYLLEHSVAGSADELREQMIGVKVFGRPAGYDTAVDNIVRVNVFLLRKKLAQYFAETGASEPLMLTIPKGSYAVEFHANDPGCLGSPDQDEHVHVNDAVCAEDAIPALPRVQSHRRRLLIAAVALLVLIVAVVALFQWNATPEQVHGNAGGHRFWSRAFGADQVVYIVVADSGFSLLQDVAGLRLGLDDYRAARGQNSERQYGNLPPELVQRLLRRDYTSVSDSAIVFRLGAIFNALGIRAVVRSARAIDVHDLKTHDAVLLGSARANPWVSLLSNKMDFHVDFDTAPPRGFVRDARPANGAPSIWRATARADQPGEAYGVISYLPNLDGTGHILSIGGTNMEGTEAAAEVLLNDVLSNGLAKSLSIPADGRLPDFEALVRARSVGGAGLVQEIVQLRVKPPK